MYSRISRIQRPRFVVGYLLVALLRGGLETGAAQTPAGIGFRSDDIHVGSLAEEYLRVLQLAGLSAPSPWTLRSFAPAYAETLIGGVESHPWSTHVDFVTVEERPIIRSTRPAVRLLYNSAFPYGLNDGAVWAGRGVTAAIELGGVLALGPLTLTIAPELFWAENRDFAILESTYDGALPFAHPWMPYSIDFPQRFDERPYARLDPGRSEVRVDYHGAALGFGTANQHWGPAHRHPILLGNNAGGFPHVFAGTSNPVVTPIGGLQARAIWGRLSDSGYSMAYPDSAYRLAAGLVGVYAPRWIPGLELGGARFFHFPWTRDEHLLERLTKPFGAILKTNVPDPRDKDIPRSLDNQLASIFFRWAALRSGFEFYGEFAREDYNFDVRDLLVEPDHTSGYLLGLQKVWAGDGPELTAVRVELLNTQLSHLFVVRTQGPYYTGDPRQGHTHRGQVLGSAYGFGGAATLIEVDRYHPAGRWRFSLSRDQLDYQAHRPQVDERRDLLHTLGVEAVRFRGPIEFAAGATTIYNRNRHYRGDEWNLNLSFGATYTLHADGAR